MSAVSLPDEERAPFDAYYTPDRHARALLWWTWERLIGPRLSVLEPSVGGGAWVRAARDVWPEATVTGMDLDPNALGLRQVDVPLVGDFLTGPLPQHYQIVIGNPPYGGDLVAWIDRARSVGSIVGFLLRSTFLGSAQRLSWWRERPPSDVVIVLPRPRWEGPGARTATDTCDSVWVLWREGFQGQQPRLHWLDVREETR